MTQDPAIIALFGPPPSNIDLTASDVSVNDGAVIALLCLAAISVVLRFTARILLRNALMTDDWAIIAALVSFTVVSSQYRPHLLTKCSFAKVCISASTGLSIAGKRCLFWTSENIHVTNPYLGGAVGAGKHIWAVSLEDLMRLYRVSLAITFSKTSNSAKLVAFSSCSVTHSSMPRPALALDSPSFSSTGGSFHPWNGR